MDVLKKTEGPKHVFFFLQKLNIPIIRYNPVFGVDDLEIANGTLIIEDIDRSFENIKLNMTALHQGETLELKIERLSGVERSRNFELILFELTMQLLYPGAH